MSNAIATSLAQTSAILANGMFGFVLGFASGAYWTLYSMRRRGRMRR